MQLPYLPKDHEIKYVSMDNPFMAQAKIARQECAGDALYPVGAVLVRGGEVLGRAGNGFNQGADKLHICPRVVEECPSGQGYDLCNLHDAPGHAERMLMKVAREQGIDTQGADVYLCGHWWCCEPCWQAMIEAGIRDVFLLENADQVFHRDKVYQKALTPSIKKVYISEALTNLPEDEMLAIKSFYEDLGRAVESIGLEFYLPHLHTDPVKHADIPAREVHDLDVKTVLENEVVVAEVSYPSLGVGGEIVEAEKAGMPVVLLSKKGAKVSRFATGNPAVVYHLVYETPEEAIHKLPLILRQM